MAILRGDIDVIFEMRETAAEHAPTELDEDIVFEAFFKAPPETQSKTHVHGKKHRSRYTAEAGDKTNAKKKETDAGGTGQKVLDSG